MAYYSNQVGPALAGLGGSILQNAQTVYQMQNRAEANRTDRMIQEAALARQQKLGQREDDLFKMQYGEALDAMKRPQKILGEGGFINNITTLAHLTVPPKDTSAPDKDQPGQRQTPAAGMALIDKFGAVLGAKYDPAKNAFVRNDGSFVSELEFRKAAPQLAGLYAANFDISKGLRDAGINAFIRFQNGEIDQQQFEKIKQDIYAKAADPVWNIQRREMQLQFLQPFRGPEADAARQRLKREIDDYMKIIAEQQGAEADRRWEREKLGIQHKYKMGEIGARNKATIGAAKIRADAYKAKGAMAGGFKASEAKGRLNILLMPFAPDQTMAIFTPQGGLTANGQNAMLNAQRYIEEAASKNPAEMTTADKQNLQAAIEAVQYWKALRGQIMSGAPAPVEGYGNDDDPLGLFED